MRKLILLLSVLSIIFVVSCTSRSPKGPIEGTIVEESVVEIDTITND